MKRTVHTQSKRKSIFRSLFAPLLLLMVLEALIFYFAAVYGGVEESLRQNAADVLAERLDGRKYEIETQFHSQWTDFDASSHALHTLYADYENRYGTTPLTENAERQIDFLQDASETLIDMLRQNEVNGVFIILNDATAPTAFVPGQTEEKYGLCIRDMDTESNYTGTEDLLVERAPSSIIDSLHCQLDSWWEAKYSFTAEAPGDYYYQPLAAAWAQPGANGRDLMYLSDLHHISGSDPAMISCSIPLLSASGYPYGVLGIELSVKHLASLLPSKELNEPDKSCYVLAMQQAESDICTPFLGTGALYNRCLGDVDGISLSKENATGGFDVLGRGNVPLYGSASELTVYNNNSPFENRRLLLLAFVENNTLFAYVDRIKLMLLFVSMLSLLLGVVGILVMSRRFAAPITALSKRVRSMRTQKDFQLERLGITEIDQLVDAIEELNRNVGKGSARTEFFSRMSHDMRTPMNAIIGFSSPELLEGADEARKDDYLRKIHASGQYLLALINEVLDMTKIESNKTELHITVLQAKRMFDTTIPIIAELAQQKRIDFAVSLDIRPDVFVRADVQHSNQIVMNLLSNAVKFTPEGGRVRLLATLADEDATSATLRVTVSDNGIGMSEAFLTNLYTPFEQENNRREGTGLGLSIARKLVELMHGTIDCESRQNEGTTFTVRLPLEKAAESEVLPSAALRSRETALQTVQGKRVLVCEDNAINMLIVQRLLEKWNIEAQHAANGRIGLDMFAASPEHYYDAVLMDVQMPVMDGLAAAQAIRALDRADARQVPIIAMTANAFREDAQASEAAGMNAHLSKPVEPDAFLSTLQQLLQK